MAREYTPNAGSQADRIHKALAKLGSATVDELVNATRLSRKRVQQEISWGKDPDRPVIVQTDDGKCTHTGLYRPRAS